VLPTGAVIDVNDELQGEPLLDVSLALPDADGMFASPASLLVNDAAWLPSDGARLVHPAVPLHAAEALGARSLRFHHQVCTGRRTGGFVR
jgi:hypothetical protein